MLGTNLTNDITLTVPTGLTLNGTNVTGGSGTYTITLANSNQSNSITATWDGTTLVNGTITAASGAVSTPINVKSDDITCFTPLYNSPIVNIITDPNMNDLANFAGWGTKSAQSTYTYCGLRSVKVTGKCGGSLDYGLNGKIKANTEYRVKAMISTNGTGEAKIGLSGVATSNVLQTISTAASEWKALDFKFTTGSTISSPNMYFNSCESQTATEGYIDNWEMYAVPKVYASPASLTIYSVGSSKKTAIRAENIFSDINITSPTGFTVSPTTMASTVSGSTADSLTVTFNGAGSSNGYVYFTSGSVKDSLYVSGVAEPALASSVGYLSMDELNTTGSFILTAANLVSDVTLTAPDGVSLNEYSIPAAIANGQTIDVLYNGKANSTGYITLTSGTASTRVRVLARRNDENYTPTYSTLTNLIGDAYINNAANFSGWGNKGINTDSMYVYSGSKSGSFYGGGQCPGSFDKVLTGTLKNSTTYLMKAKVYAIGGGVHLGFYNSGASDIVSPTISTTDSWQDAELKFTTPAALSTNYGVFFNSCWTGANNGYIDNWELYELPTINVSGNNATLDSLIYTTPGTSFDLPISASGFTNNLIVSSDNPNFVPTPATLPSTGGTVSVLFVGTVSDAGTLTISAANNASPAPGMQRISFSGTTITVPMKATVLITGVNLPKVESFSLLSANNILSAKFNLLKNADVEFGVYTTNGMLITNYKQSFQSGSHQKDLVSNLQKGIYLVKITIDGQSITKKITN